MPVQRFAPMTKDFATFDCDAHVTEPPLIWERAKDFLTRDELDALKQTIWWDADSRLLIVNGRAGVGLGSPRKGGIPGTMRVITNAGPGVKHDIQRALNVRNLHPKTALTQEHVAYLDHAGSYEPEPRLRDMDIQGIDQVMIIPTDIDTYPWLQNALGAKAFCKAYNEWAYEYTLADPERLFFAALLPMQNPSTPWRRSTASRPRGVAWPSSARWTPWATIPFSPSMNPSGTPWRRPAWSTACTPSRPAAISSHRAMPSNILAPS